MQDVLSRLHSPAFVAAACAVLLIGCTPEYSEHGYGAYYAASMAAPRTSSAKAKIPLPGRALLEPQAEPACEVEQAQQRPGATAALNATPDGAADPNAELAMRIKLDYERECYRQAEQRVRERLKQLQASTAQTIKTVKSAEQAAAR